jgi:hypothetical protein
MRLQLLQIHNPLHHLVGQAKDSCVQICNQGAEETPVEQGRFEARLPKNANKHVALLLPPTVRLTQLVVRRLCFAKKS